MANALDPIHAANFSFAQNGVNTSIDQAAFVKSVIQKQPSLASNQRNFFNQLFFNFWNFSVQSTDPIFK